MAESTVRKAIEACYAELSAQQRRAAEYLLAHHRTAFALSVHELARTVRVSEATLVRFARQLGFAGYLELRAALMQEAKKDLAPEDRFALEQPSAEPGCTLKRVGANEAENIRRTVEGVNPRDYRQFVDRLRRASEVTTLGLGVSGILARLAAYLLFQVGVRASLLSRDVLSLGEQIDRLPKSSALLVFGFPPYSKKTVDAAAQARARKLTVLAITDGAGSPLVAHATATLFASNDNILYTNSISGALVLVNALVTDLALSDKARALGQLRASSRALTDEQQ